MNALFAAAADFEALCAARGWRFCIIGPANALSTTRSSAAQVVRLVPAEISKRAQDWLDIEGIIVRQGPSLDRVLIGKELHALLSLKEDSEPEVRLRRLFDKHSPR